jgi:hypothetical protein
MTLTEVANGGIQRLQTEVWILRCALACLVVYGLYLLRRYRRK